MIKGSLSLIGLFVGAAVLLCALIFLFHRLWVLIKGNRDIVDWKDYLKMSMAIFVITVVSLVFIIMFVL